MKEIKVLYIKMEKINGFTILRAFLLVKYFSKVL